MDWYKKTRFATDSASSDSVTRDSIIISDRWHYKELKYYGNINCLDVNQRNTVKLENMVVTKTINEDDFNLSNIKW
jgi:hypothetical protein